MGPFSSRLALPECTHQPHQSIQSLTEPCEARFNGKHYCARSIVEKAFGMLKRCWRSVCFKVLEVNPAFMTEVFACCAVLHNVAPLNGDIVEPADEEDHDDAP